MHLCTGIADRGTIETDGFVADGFGVMSVQAQLALEYTMALVTYKIRAAVVPVRFGVVLATVLEAGSTMIALIIGAGVVSQIIVPGKPVRAEVIFTDETHEGGQSVVKFVLDEDPEHRVPMAVGEAGVAMGGVIYDDLKRTEESVSDNTKEIL